MFDIDFSGAHKQTLREQVIDAGHPGSVLRDFQMLLEFVAPHGVKAAGKHNLLPINLIDELDLRLSRPLRLGSKMKRPQLRSHPYLQALHLLLRASGLSRVEGTGSKALLVIDAAMRDRWQQLNFTEQYFTLLEAGFRVGRPEMVGEPGGRWNEALLLGCWQTWREIPAKGRKFDVQRPQEVFFLGIGRHFYQLALLDLFGLMEVEHPRSAVQPWCPSAIRHVPFGDALLMLLAPRVISYGGGNESADEEKGGSPSAAAFGKWQLLVQPYFPEWRLNLVLPQAKASKGIFVFRVSLDDIWREIAMKPKSTVDELVDWILQSFKFDDDHLYTVSYRDRFGAKVELQHPFMEEGPWADDATIGDLGLEPGQSMSLLYDFGDSWMFSVKLDRIEPPGTRIKAPRILTKHGKSPEQYPGREW